MKIKSYRNCERIKPHSTTGEIYKALDEKFLDFVAIKKYSINKLENK